MEVVSYMSRLFQNVGRRQVAALSKMKSPILVVSPLEPWADLNFRNVSCSVVQASPSVSPERSIFLGGKANV